MKAIVLTKLGGANVLKVKEIPKPSIINPTDVLIKMKYSGINFAEILARRGLYKWVPARKGFILGMEGSGIVEEVGNEVTTCKVGDPVIVARGFGCHAEYISLEEKYVFPAILDSNYLEIKKSFVELVDLVLQQKITPVIGKIFPLEEIIKAHQMIESRNSIGKILLKIDA